MQAEVRDLCFYTKQFNAAAVGVAFGVGEIHGLTGFGFFGIFNLFFTWIVYAKLARVDLEEAGFVGQSELQGHGMAPSVVSFVFWWMLAHTLTHHA